jgi:hypothetical protein
LWEQREKVKKEHDTRFPEGEEHLHLKGDIYENWMGTIRSPQHFQPFSTSFAIATTINTRRYSGY